MFPYMINNPHLCMGVDRLYFIILIVSAADHFGQLAALRRTWPQQDLMAQYPFQTVYLIGNTYNEDVQRRLIEENANNHDIVQSDFKDSYHNLTLKVLTGLKWVIQYCHQARYVLRANDDVYQDTLNIVQVLECNYSTIRRTVFGNLMQYAAVHRVGAGCTTWSAVHHGHAGL